MKNLLLFGLGNPGDEYRFTRHNAGRIILDLIAQRYKLHWKSEQGIHSCSFQNGEYTIQLVLSTSYMNESGKDLGKWLRYRNNDDLPVLLIIQDDSDQQSGKCKLVQGGGSAGHWGVESVYQSLVAWYQRDEVWRLKLGIRPIGNKKKSETFVLKSFSEVELKQLGILSQQITDIKFLELLLEKNPSHAQSIINSLNLSEHN